MLTFPVTSSILSKTHLAQFLQKSYGLLPTTTCKLLKAGVNHSYLVTDGSTKAIFRLYSLNWRTEVEINEELKLLTLLNQNGIPVSYPLTDVQGRYIQTLNAPEGTRFGVLFSFAQGEKLLTFSADLHYKLGQIMARFHQLTHNLTQNRVTYTPQRLLVDSLAQLPLFLSPETDEMKFMLETQQYLLREFAGIDTTKTRRGTVHLDIWFDNLNIDRDEQITLFDFDFCGNGMLCLDLAYYILQIHSTEADVNEFRQKKDSFLAGYESITALSDEEKRLLPMLGLSVYFFYLGVQMQRFDDWSNTFLNELYLTRFINLRIKRWADFNELNAKR
ncbi:phosphotransferase enzyme family protein [Spirosoma fluviale]|uniref:Ser/Thr protein kinase RdoA involved in Cpx stress response, MazF antagonist n=1 Tax=Spirosoma fluviale TaxID=1597977 RepID=A0A286GDX7_9BACT|nr:phosphotransferase [Spirosoma fluviale]SOD93710.1 Ser/Thr protein kinase RdoA involved in Cpx stress response, MazF antagonist [Spirosoma fluviale]